MTSQTTKFQSSKNNATDYDVRRGPTTMVFVPSLLIEHSSDRLGGECKVSIVLNARYLHFYNLISLCCDDLTHVLPFFTCVSVSGPSFGPPYRYPSSLGTIGGDVPLELGSLHLDPQQREAPLVARKLFIDRTQ
jgi:hypothetical protein